LIFVNSLITGFLLSIYLSVTCLDSFLQGKNYITDDFSIVNYLILYSPIYVIAFGRLENMLNYAKMQLLRYKKISKWWIAEQYKNIVYIFLCYYSMSIFLLIKNQKQFNYKVCVEILLFILHSITIYSIGAFLRILSSSMKISLLSLIIVETLEMKLLILGIGAPRIITASWGIYNYIDRIYGDGGFSLAIVLTSQIICTGFIVWIFPCIAKQQFFGRI